MSNERYKEARADPSLRSRLMLEAEELGDQLAPFFGDDRAYEVAGVRRADQRAVNAYQRLMRLGEPPLA